MARAWTESEKNKYREELKQLYVCENKSISEIGVILGLSDAGIFDRLLRLDIKTARNKKPGFNKQRNDIHLPRHSARLAEFIGVMLGDGHISHFQTLVTLGTKEEQYVHHVASLMRSQFGVSPNLPP